ncbi:hypothetical protein C8F01DRAFT_682681 [Mycena amicta]|nr:hypothetical protein C8F01DRAFT_682681 [Mycena amicta]
MANTNTSPQTFTFVFGDGVLQLSPASIGLIVSQDDGALRFEFSNPGNAAVGRSISTTLSINASYSFSTVASGPPPPYSLAPPAYTPPTVDAAQFANAAAASLPTAPPPPSQATQSFVVGYSQLGEPLYQVAPVWPQTIQPVWPQTIQLGTMHAQPLSVGPTPPTVNAAAASLPTAHPLPSQVTQSLVVGYTSLGEPLYHQPPRQVPVRETIQHGTVHAQPRRRPIAAAQPPSGLGAKKFDFQPSPIPNPTIPSAPRHQSDGSPSSP